MRTLAATTLALLSAASACDKDVPSCDDLQRRLRLIVTEDEAHWRQVRPASDGLDFRPRLGDDAIGVLVEACRAGAMSAETRRCLAAARTVAAVDRCVARAEPP